MEWSNLCNPLNEGHSDLKQTAQTDPIDRRHIGLDDTMRTEAGGQGVIMPTEGGDPDATTLTEEGGLDIGMGTEARAPTGMVGGGTTMAGGIH